MPSGSAGTQPSPAPVSGTTPLRVAAWYASVALIPSRTGKRSCTSRSRSTAAAPRSSTSAAYSSHASAKGSSGRGKRSSSVGATNALSP